MIIHNKYMQLYIINEPLLCHILEIHGSFDLVFEDKSPIQKCIVCNIMKKLMLFIMNRHEEAIFNKR